MTVLLVPCTVTLPPLPEGTSEPYVVSVPRFGSSTVDQVRLKNAYWPTMFTPNLVTRETEWSKEEVDWIRLGIETVVKEAKCAKSRGEVSIISFYRV